LAPPHSAFLLAQGAGEESLGTLKTQFFGVLFNTTASSMPRRRHLNLARRLNARGG
jgi:hypothetical protein